MTQIECTRDGRSTAFRPPLQGNPNRTEPPLVFYDEDFYTKTRNLSELGWTVGRSRYCPVGTFVCALMSPRCACIGPTRRGAEKDANVVLTIGSYRAQSVMVCHCLRLLLNLLPGERRSLILFTCVLQTGTATSQQSCATRHTVVAWPVLLQRMTIFARKLGKMVNAFSRHLGKLCLIHPWSNGDDVRPDVRRLYDLLSTYAFADLAHRTDLVGLASDIYGVASDPGAGRWAWDAFFLWTQSHSELQSRLQYDDLLPATALDATQDSGSDIVDTCVQGPAPVEGVIPAVCAASVEDGLRLDCVIEPIAPQVPKAIWNFMRYLLQILASHLENAAYSVTVTSSRDVKDLLTLSADNQTEFEPALDHQFPNGSKLAGVVLDLIVNYQRWNSTQYLYACIARKHPSSEFQFSTPFAATMGMLLFKCTKMACADEDLKTACRGAFHSRSCRCLVAWELHKYDMDTDGSVVKKMEGGGGRIDYHIAAACAIHNATVHYEAGHVYHTTHWRQNTYHPTGTFAPCSRALLVCRNTSLAKPFRTAIASARLAFSSNDGPGICCVLLRHQPHPEDVVAPLPLHDTAPDAQVSPWKFPPLARPAERETNIIVENIIRQFNLVCPEWPPINDRIKMVECLLATWDPQKATVMKVDRNVLVEVTAWLLSLHEGFQLHRS